MKKKLAEELALISCEIVQGGQLNGTVMQTFDKAYKIAKKFLKEFPLDTKWGFGEGFAEWDEEVQKFTQKYLEDGN